MVQRLEHGCLIDVDIGNHHKQIFCYVASLNVFTIVPEDGWLQTHNPAIDWKDQTMKFNSALCMESGCLAHGMLCVEFAIGSKAKNRIGLNKFTAVDSGDINIDIKPVNPKHFL